jgi:hypothetical protein
MSAATPPSERVYNTLQHADPQTGIGFFVPANEQKSPVGGFGMKIINLLNNFNSGK